MNDMRMVKVFLIFFIMITKIVCFSILLEVVLASSLVVAFSMLFITEEIDEITTYMKFIGRKVTCI